MRRASQTIVLAGLWLFCLASRWGDTFTVTSTDSLGPGSLYEAINQANAHPGADTITFNIPGSGVHEISVGDNGLPEITDPVTIDGYTQPGAKANSLAVSDDAIILIQIDGILRERWAAHQRGRISGPRPYGHQFSKRHHSAGSGQ